MELSGSTIIYDETDMRRYAAAGFLVPEQQGVVDALHTAAGLQAEANRRTRALPPVETVTSYYDRQHYSTVCHQVASMKIFAMAVRNTCPAAAHEAYNQTKGEH